MRILVIGAHPDDEVFGCGATIARHAALGDQVYVMIVSEGVSAQYEDKEKFLKLRRDACLKVAKYLGVKKVFFEEFPDMKMDSIPHLEINKSIEKIVEKVKPQRIYTHHYGDLNKDHRVVFESTLVAARKKVKEVYCYEILGNMSKGFQKYIPFIPDYYINIEKFLNKKLKALSFYHTEIKEFPSPFSEEAVESLAKLRGVESNLKAAEAFVCVKRIEI